MTASATAKRVATHDSPLAQTIASTPTDIWNDSCSTEELSYAISFGAVGATVNPTIVTDVWRSESSFWRRRVREITEEQPEATSSSIAWSVAEEMSLRAAPLLLPAFEHHGGRQGRLSIQTDPTLYMSSDQMVAQGQRFSDLAPNVVVKFPVTTAGIEAIEEATYRGISINATVCFSLAQAIAAAKAVERGLDRREAEGLSTSTMGPVVTLMMGRLEDWLRVLVERDGIIVDPTAIPWAGVAVFKRAYAEFRQRGYRARLLGAAIRHHLHWTELVGGDVAITLPATWQHRFNASGIQVGWRIDEPVPKSILKELAKGFDDFQRAVEVDGLAAREFDTFGPTVRTLRTFITSYRDLLGLVTDAMLPDPDTVAVDG